MRHTTTGTGGSITADELYYDADDVLDSAENAGLDAALRHIREAPADYTVVDAAAWSREQAEDAYQRLAIPPSVRNRYRVRRVFGSNKYSGSFFGKGVPALVVLHNGRPQDVYPHEEQDGTIVTINDYLEARARAEGGRALAERMNAVRARIGPIGVPVRELIDEGRRR